MSRPRLVLTELREYRSGKGSTYFAGYLGKARLVMLRDDRAEITGKEVACWNVILEEPEPRGGRADRTGEPQGGRNEGGTSAGAAAVPFPAALGAARAERRAFRISIMTRKASSADPSAFLALRPSRTFIVAHPV